MEIWINPACSKCRAATATLDEAGIDYTVRRYLDEPADRRGARRACSTGSASSRGTSRGPVKRGQGGRPATYPRDAEHRDRWLAAMVAHPR